MRELLEYGRDWLKQTKEVLFVDSTHDQRCKSACLDCLLSFETQDAMHQGFLSRPLALSVLSNLLDGEDMVVSSTTDVRADDGTQSDSQVTTTQLTRQERLERARVKRARKRS